MSAAPRDPTLAMLAPQLLVLEGGIGLPGWVRWVAGFTTGPEEAPMLHRASLQGEVDADRRLGPVEWRLESQALGLTPGLPARIVQGESRGLSVALDAALAAAGRDPDGAPLPLGPAFVLLRNAPGRPRIWGAAALLSGAPGILGRSCFIRERLGGPHLRYDGMLEAETSPHAPPLLRHWSTTTLADAAEQGRQALLDRASLVHPSRSAG